jgi:hypothetical protein
MQRIIYWLGIAACIILIIACFLPWTYHGDVGKNFTGFFSEKNAYGRPGRYLIFFTVIILSLMLLPKIWAKRTNIFMGAVIVSYAVKTYILYTSCYMAYCPEKKAGVFLMLFSSVVIFIATIFPNMKLPAQKKEAPASL